VKTESIDEGLSMDFGLIPRNQRLAAGRRVSLDTRFTTWEAGYPMS